MLCSCEQDKQTASRIMSDYNSDLGEQGVSSLPALMVKIVDMAPSQSQSKQPFFRTEITIKALITVWEDPDI